LDPEATYRVTALDRGESFDVTGGALLDAGLPITLGDMPASAVLRYQRVHGCPGEDRVARDS
jgi:hypothetical protein